MQSAAASSPSSSVGKQPPLKRSQENIPSSAEKTAQKIPFLIAKLAEVAEDPLPLNHQDCKVKKLYNQMNTVYWDSGPLTKPTNELINHGNKNFAQARLLQNRYPNILPYDGHIWKPQHPAIPEDFYLNASPFDDGDRCYISTQGPMANTVGDFLNAVVLSGCRVVLTLANAIEGDRVKTEPWWDLCKAIPMKLYGGFSIQYMDEESFSHPEALDGQLLIIRRFMVRDSEHKEVRIVSQIHHLNWKDHGPPDRNLFREAQERVNRLNPDKTPIVCHCSAGCGRTGTWIAADRVWRKIQAQLSSDKTMDQIDVDIEGEIIQMRRIRAQMVQSTSQLKAIYEILLWRLRQISS